MIPRDDRSNALQLAAALLLVAGSLVFFRNPGAMAVNWTFPYLSGAANFNGFSDWRISPSEYDAVANMPLSEYRTHRHQATADTVPYNINSYGYVLVALAARSLLPWMGDLNACVLLQCAVHLLLVTFMWCCVLKGTRVRWAFILLYGANPLVAYFVTYPFYYFWTCIPGLALATVWLRPDWAGRAALAATPLVLLSLWTRPTTLLLAALVYPVAWLSAGRGQNRRLGRVLTVVGACAFALGILGLERSRTTSPYHTMYIGIGAYANDSGVRTLADEEGYAYFTLKTGTQINTNAVAGNWRDADLRRQYQQSVRERYQEIARESPLLLARNATYNLCQAFSLGYVVGKPLFQLASGLTGVVVLAFLVWRRQWVWIAGVLAYAAAYAWYFPPIPAYHFGAYSLLVLGVIQAFANWRGKPA